MPKRIPNNTVIVIRDGKRVKPEIGKPFDFTQEEVDGLKTSNPKALRHPINEGTDAPAAEDDDKKAADTKADDKKPAGKKTKADDL